jgi:DNA polymerase V
MGGASGKSWACSLPLERADVHDRESVAVAIPHAISIFLAYHDADPAASVVRLPVLSDRFDILLDVARHGLRSVYRPGKIATHMHVVASKLKRGPWQQSLFDVPNPKLEAIAKTKREINEWYGRWKLRSGATLWANEFYQDNSNEFEICDVRGKFCF